MIFWRNKVLHLDLSSVVHCHTLCKSSGILPICPFLLILVLRPSLYQTQYFLASERAGAVFGHQLIKPRGLIQRPHEHDPIYPKYLSCAQLPVIEQPYLAGWTRCRLRDQLYTRAICSSERETSESYSLIYYSLICERQNNGEYSCKGLHLSASVHCRRNIW